jgi:nucleotide-binding universal stress UspA family protein
VLFGRELHSILVATDGSPTARDAEDVAAELATGHGAELLIVHVVRPVDFAGATLEQPGYAMRHEAGEDDRAVLEAAVARAAARGVHVTTALRFGSTADEIVSYAEAHAVDLIVVGSHGHGRVAGMVLGSVSRGVLHTSMHPVLVVRGKSSMHSTPAPKHTTAASSIGSVSSRQQPTRR